ncbi:MAG: ABC transporter permease [Nevskiaceae bacterium]
MSAFSLARLSAVVRKEFIQMRRDRLTFAMMVGIPLMQLVIFGYAINFDPRDLPTAVVSAEQTSVTRSLEAALENSGYFRVVEHPATVAEGERLLEIGRVQFLLQIPAGFTRALVRGERPALLLAADAADPTASGNAIAAVGEAASTALREELKGPLAHLAPGAAPFELRLHRRYNPEGITAYNIVPGLMGVILTMTMVMMTALGVTRELERGTMENLMAMPVQPLEVMIGKIVPYIVVGYVQCAMILLGAVYLFGVPILGSLTLLSASLLVFIIASLTVGITFSSVAQNMAQAMQMSFFFLLPSIMLSGFMFPFRGMPGWAQWLGEALPLTHFLRVVRGIMLKGHGLAEAWHGLWPLLVFTVVVMALGVTRYRRTLD